MEITSKLVEDFKGRMHISHDGEDDNLKKLLSSSAVYVKSKCGEFAFDSQEDNDIRAKELVMERARYAYNDAVEYFEDNFLSDINSLGFDMAFAKEGEKNEGV